MLEQKIRSLILDMDGVLWKGDHPIIDIPVVFDKIKRRGFKLMLATNNATKSIDQYVNKLNGFGADINKWQVINSSLATAEYLSRVIPGNSSVFVVGEEGLITTLEEFGFTIASENANAVVVALDRGLTYEKIKTASLLIRSGALFIATNPDPTYPTLEGQAPGSGSIVAAVETAAGVRPTVIGKPYPEMYQIALQRLGTTPSETMVIGDRLETDIAGGQAAGCITGLVLSGVTTDEEAQAWKPAPDIIANDLAHIMELI